MRFSPSDMLGENGKFTGTPRIIMHPIIILDAIQPCRGNSLQVNVICLLFSSALTLACYTSNSSQNKILQSQAQHLNLQLLNVEINSIPLHIKESLTVQNSKTILIVLI